MTIAILNLSHNTAVTTQDFAASEVRTVIANQLGVKVERVTDEAHFTDDLGADWLDLLELMFVIEDQFVGVEMRDDEIDQIQVVGDLISHIENVNNERLRRGATPPNPQSIRASLSSLREAPKHQEGREQAAFFLRLAKDALRSVTGWCALTRRPVDLQIYADQGTLSRIRSNSVRFQCPHCGGEHETKVEVACPEAAA